MAGNKEGGMKARTYNYLVYGPDFYKRIGALGGRASRTGGFASNLVGQDGLTGRQRAAIVGAIGGRKSKRRPKKNAVKAYVSLKIRGNNHVRRTTNGHGQ